MRIQRPRFRFLLFGLGWALAIALPLQAKRVHYIRPVVASFPAQGLGTIVIENLDGPITLSTETTSTVKVEALIHAGGADETFARTLSDQLRLTPHVVGNQLRIVAHYPVMQFHDYGYPHIRSLFHISMFHFFHGTDTNRYEHQTVHVRKVGSGQSVELWTEIRVTAPPTVTVYVRNVYGNVESRGHGPAGNGELDAFTSAGDIVVNNPRWSKLNLQSDYGAVKFPRGLGVAENIKLKTHFGGAFLFLAPGASGQIIARKNLGFLHNSFTKGHFTRHGNHWVMLLGDGHGPIVHVDMQVGSLHLQRQQN